MKRVIVGFDKNGEPYVMKCPKRVEVVFVKKNLKPKKTLKKKFRTAVYQVKTFLQGAAS